MPDITFTLLVDGAPASEDILDALETVEIETHHRLADILRLHLTTAIRDDGSGWRSLDDEVFGRLTNLRLLVTIGSSLPVTLIDGYVVETKATLSDDPGRSTFDVVAMDGTVLMNLEERVRAWPDMSDSSVATAIFGEHGLIPIVDDTSPSRREVDTTVMQRDTDIRFLRHLADRNGFEVFVTPGPAPGTVEGHFHAPRVDDPPQGVLSVGMGDLSNVAQLETRYEMLRPSEVTVSGVDAEGLDHQPVDVSTTSLTELGNRALRNGTRPRRSRLQVTGLSQTAELQALAQAATDRSGWAVSVSGQVDTAIYQDVISPASVIQVRGAGEEFSGTYYVERVLHRLAGSEYTQSFSLRRNALQSEPGERFVTDGALRT